MLFYLSGGMEHAENLGKGWRDIITRELEEVGHEALDPVKIEEQSQAAMSFDWVAAKKDTDLAPYKAMVRQCMFRKDMLAIQEADAVILNYDVSVQKGAGTLAEAWEAFREGRPVYLFTEFPLEQVPGWLIAETTEVFKTRKEVVEYVSDPGRVFTDIVQAKLIRDVCLKGVYDKR